MDLKIVTRFAEIVFTRQLDIPHGRICSFIQLKYQLSKRFPLKENEMPRKRRYGLPSERLWLPFCYKFLYKWIYPFFKFSNYYGSSLQTLMHKFSSQLWKTKHTKQYQNYVNFTLRFTNLGQLSNLVHNKLNESCGVKYNSWIFLCYLKQKHKQLLQSARKPTLIFQGMEVQTAHS